MNKFILFFVFTCVILTTNAQDTIASGTCGENLTWALTKDSVLTINGSGKMDDYYLPSQIPWFSYQSFIATIELGNEVESIGGFAFYDCVNGG